MKTNPLQTNRKFWLSAAIGLALLFMAATPRTVMVQWATNGNNINNTNTGNVGIGTSAPNAKLAVSTNSVTLPSGTGAVMQVAAADGVQSIVITEGFATNGAFLLRRA